MVAVGRVNDGKNVKFIIDNKKLAQVLTSPSGPVVQDLIRRCEILQAAAQRQIPMGHVGTGVGHGNLRYSLVKRVTPGSYPGMPEAMVGSSHPIALIHHEGTKPHEIIPRRAAVLAFPAAWAENGVAFAMIVFHPGTKPNRYLTDNLHLALR